MATYPSAEIGRKMKRDRQKAETSSSKAAAAAGAGKGKIWEEEQEQEQQQQQQPPDAGMDELLAVLGYKVRASDMAEVAQKLEQLEMVMGTKIEDGLSHLSTDVVHYNPSDLSGWVQTMLYELNNTPTPTNFDDVSNLRTSIGDDFSTTINFSSANRICDDDLRAIPGGAIFGNNNIHDDSKEKKKDLEVEAGIKRRKSGFDSAEASESAKAVVLLDSQETGIRLVHTLMACAEAVQQENLKLADALVKHIGLLAVSQAGAMRKVTTYFAEALARRIYKIYPLDSLQLQTSYSDVLEMHFYETCPYLKFAHFTANQAILEAFGTANRVHVIDFSLKQGMQWPALMQALALRSGGPPAFRLTGIGPQQPENTDTLHQVVWRLARFADTIGVEFEFSGFFVNSLADQDATMPEIPSNDLEFVAVNSVLELHGLLSRPGAIEKVLDSIKAMKPKIVTLVEQEANHNGTVFLDRFNEALHYYSTMFDSLESSARLTQPNSQDLVMSEVYLGRQICNVVACEGVHRVERHETLSQWRGRFKAAGFDPVHLGSSAFKQASMLLALFAGGDGYRVEENEGCLMLGWHTRPLIATSAWQLGGAAESQGANSVVGESWFVNN